MNDQDKMQLALASMHTGQWFGFDGEINYENLIILDSSKTKPTEDEINTKIQEMENKITTIENLKKSAKAKLIAGEPLTEEEADTIVL
ncbi:hypothetical protein EXVC032PBaldr_046 [Pelagibacter phage EXVC031P Hodr]|jgi:hypothetical protein|nr:hypothetical protein EXVC032PBaldr_046 [Pelagibacter phage EXVC031P Hodr]